jgi:hypothetical protein
MSRFIKTTLAALVAAFALNFGTDTKVQASEKATMVQSGTQAQSNWVYYGRYSFYSDAVRVSNYLNALGYFTYVEYAFGTWNVYYA